VARAAFASADSWTRGHAQDGRKLDAAEGVLESFLRISTVAAPAFCVIGTLLMALGTDEAWILLGVRGLVDSGTYGLGSPIRSDFTTAGPHTVLACLLDGWSGGRLEVIRLISPLSLIALFVVSHQLTRRVQSDRGAVCWMALSSILAVRGTFLLGAQAHGEVLAMVFVAAGALLWDRLPPSSWSRRMGAGVLLGLAAATRLNCVLGAFALPLAACWAGRARRRTELCDGLLAMVLALALLGIQWATLAWFSVPLHPDAARAARTDCGLGGILQGPLTYLIPMRLNFWIVGEDLIPLGLAVLVTVGWLWARQTIPTPKGIDFLLTFAWLLWIAWHVQAPIPHLRYLWPALVPFFLAGGAVLARLHRAGVEERRPSLRLGTIAVCVALVVSGTLDGVRTYLSGDADLISWEWQRGTRHSLQYGPFTAARSQREMSRHLRQLPPGDTVVSLGFDTALTYLSGRPVRSVQCCYPGASEGVYRLAPEDMSADEPRWLAVTPFVSRFPYASYLSPRLHQWIEQHCGLAARHGQYLLYRILDRLPETDEIFRLSSWEPPLPLADLPAATPNSR
jgi:hypothetical protein